MSGKNFRIFVHLNFRICTFEFCDYKYDTRYNQFIENINDDYKSWRFTTVLDAFAKKRGLTKSQLKKHFGDLYQSKLEEFVLENAKSIIRLAALDDKQIGQEAIKYKQLSINAPGSIVHMPREDAKDFF